MKADITVEGDMIGKNFDFVIGTDTENVTKIAQVFFGFCDFLYCVVFVMYLYQKKKRVFFLQSDKQLLYIVYREVTLLKISLISYNFIFFVLGYHSGLIGEARFFTLQNFRLRESSRCSATTKHTMSRFKEKYQWRSSYCISL